MVAEGNNEPTILRLRQVLARTGLARSTLYERVRLGEFPKPISLGPRSVGWIDSDVSGWIVGRIEASRKRQLGLGMTPIAPIHRRTTSGGRA